jgi:DNA polymerase III epsilon subunit-like protein
MFQFGNPEAAHTALQLFQSAPVFLDTETTGIGPHAEVIEIAIIDTQGKLIFESLVKPRGLIEADAIRVHGITADLVQDAPTWQDVWPLVEPHLLAQPVGAYNVDFDLRLMKQTHKRSMLTWQVPENQFFCIMKLFARFAGEWVPNRRSFRWHSLEQAGRMCRLSLTNTHHAQDDALLARAILEFMANWQAG